MESVEQLLGIEMIDILSYASGIAAFIVLFAIYQASLARDPMKGRIKALQERRDMLKSGLIATRRRASPLKKSEGVDLLRTIAEKLKLLQTEQNRKTLARLVQAGYRGSDALVLYQISRLVLPMLFGLVAVFLFYGMGAMPDKQSLHPLFSIGAVLAGFKLPDIIVTNARQKRTAALRKGLPDALDLLVVCAEAGLTLDTALQRVSRELGRATPELAEEFGLTSIELGFLPERRQALLNLAERVDLPALRGVVTTLVQSERYGTPLATSLRVLSAEFRNERMMKAEEKAARLPAIMTVPLILFIMPALFVVLIGPAACRMSENFINR